MNEVHNSLTIEPSDLDNGIFYRIKHDGQQPSGNASVIFSTVSTYEERKIQVEAIRQGLLPNDLVAEITDFYPNGKSGDWCEDRIVPFMRQGVGSRVLERVVEDSIKHGAKLLYVETGKDSMRSFLRKKGYHEFKGERAYMSYFCKPI